MRPRTPGPRRRTAELLRALAGAVLGLLLYAAIAPAANAQELDADGRAELRALAIGEVGRLVVHETPRPRMETAFHDGQGREVRLADFAGEVVVLNFWATWCPPCRAEMPSLDRLAGEMGAARVRVLAVSTDFGSSEKPAKFLSQMGAQHLALHHDRSRGLAREAAILGLPVTLLLDREGREVARLTGDAHWDRPEVLELMRALVRLTEPGARA